MLNKKSKLYSLLWSKCGKLRGRMEVGDFKDYVLVLLFAKCASDRFADVPDAPIVIPPGARFRDLIALKGRPDIGRRINEWILAPLAAANGLTGLPDFNDASKLGPGAEMVDRLTALISVFECEEFDFSMPYPEEDEDLLGGAYEYLLRYVASARGARSNRPFAPAEVNEVIARILGIGPAATDAATAYDPICDFGSPLVRLNIECHRRLTLYGQAEVAASSGLAHVQLRCNDRCLPWFACGNVFTDPQFRDGDKLKTFDFVVANPPPDRGAWRSGIDPMRDPFNRFQSFGAPPELRRSYAYLLHVVQSLNATGRGVCVMPQRALSRGSRGDAEAEIRWALVRKGLISGIIGLPPDLFFGTGIAMCLAIVDRRGAYSRKGIFMIDAGPGFVRDGSKNRLREQDVSKIVDVFAAGIELPHYSRMVPIHEIAKAEFRLDIRDYFGRREPHGVHNVGTKRRVEWPPGDVDTPVSDRPRFPLSRFETGSLDAVSHPISGEM